VAAFELGAVVTDIPATHYVKSDDVHIAYQVLGGGSFDLLFVPGFVSNVEAIWQSPYASPFFRRLASFSRLILFDKRGTGHSPWCYPLSLPREQGTLLGAPRRPKGVGRFAAPEVLVAVGC
jgi:pimeloyl-ACP methyl ester carboxylesterase